MHSGKCSRKSSKKMQFQDPYYWTFFCNINVLESLTECFSLSCTFSSREQKLTHSKCRTILFSHCLFVIVASNSLLLLFLLNNYVGTLHPFISAAVVQYIEAYFLRSYVIFLFFFLLLTSV